MFLANRFIIIGFLRKVEYPPHPKINLGEKHDINNTSLELTLEQRYNQESVTTLVNSIQNG